MVVVYKNRGIVNLGQVVLRWSVVFHVIFSGANSVKKTPGFVEELRWPRFENCCR